METIKYNELVRAWEKRQAISYRLKKSDTTTDWETYTDRSKPPAYDQYLDCEFEIGPAPRYRIGSVFKVPPGTEHGGDEEYMLSQVLASQCCLIGLKNGNRLVDPFHVHVDGNYSISEDDISKMLFPKTTIDMYERIR